MANRKIKEDNDEKRARFIFSSNQQENTNITKNAFMLFALLLSVSLLLTACSSANSSNLETTNNQGQNPRSDGQAVNSGDIASLNASIIVSMDATNKSEVQKTQEQLAQLIADGTYDDQVTYTTHAGEEVVEMKVTTKGDVITSVSVTPVKADMMSQKIIGNFNAALPGLVVGKKISDISLPHNVAGSSLTSAAFTQHLKDLVAQHPA